MTKINQFSLFLIIQVILITHKKSLVMTKFSFKEYLKNLFNHYVLI